VVPSNGTKGLPPRTDIVSVVGHVRKVCSMKRSVCQSSTGVAINGDFCEPSRLILIRAADIDPINNVAVRPDHIGAIFFHRTALSMIGLPPNLKTGLKGRPFENENGSMVLCVGCPTFISGGDLSLGSGGCHESCSKLTLGVEALARPAIH
jgi:hypothetical protein